MEKMVARSSSARSEKVQKFLWERLNKNMWQKLKVKTAGSPTTTRNAFQIRIQAQKTKSFKGLLQQVHVLLPVKFKISSARRPNFNYM